MTFVCRHVNRAHHYFLGQSKMDSFLLTLKSITLKKNGLEGLKISAVVARVPWKFVHIQDICA